MKLKFKLVNGYSVLVDKNAEINENEYYVSFEENYSVPQLVIYVKSTGLNGKNPMKIVFAEKELNLDSVPILPKEIIDKYKNNMKKVFKIPVTWEAYGVVKIEAETLDEAIQIFDETEDDISLPTDSEYVDASFRREDEETCQLHNTD